LNQALNSSSYFGAMSVYARKIPRPFLAMPIAPFYAEGDLAGTPVLFSLSVRKM
jgi:hypothetical protein